MRTQNSVVSSLLTTLTSHRAARAQRRELAMLLSDPELSPSARQEMVAILARDEDVLTSVAVPSQRRGGASASTPARGRSAPPEKAGPTVESDFRPGFAALQSLRGSSPPRRLFLSRVRPPRGEVGGPEPRRFTSSDG